MGAGVEVAKNQTLVYKPHTHMGYGLVLEEMMANVIDALHLRSVPGGRPDLVVGPKASDNRGFEKHQVGGWSHPGAVG
jgi:hypothetical protein